MNLDESVERYRHALSALAAKQAIERQVADELAGLVALIEREKLLRNCLGNPSLPLAVKQVSILLSELVGFLKDRLNEHEERVIVMVESALPILQTDRDDLTHRISQWLHKQVLLQIKVVPQLIAGITIRVGDRMVDGSCRGQLARLRQHLMG